MSVSPFSESGLFASADADLQMAARLLLQEREGSGQMDHLPFRSWQSRAFPVQPFSSEFCLNIRPLSHNFLQTHKSLGGLRSSSGTPSSLEAIPLLIIGNSEVLNPE